MQEYPNILESFACILSIFVATLKIVVCSNCSLPCFHYSSSKYFSFQTLPANKFIYKLSSNVPISMLKNPSFCYLASFLVVSRKTSTNKPDSSIDLTSFMTSSIFEMKLSMLPSSNLRICLRIPAPAADSAAVDPNGTKIFLVNGLITSFIEGKPASLMV